jgi:hypothetical protein
MNTHESFSHSLVVSKLWLCERLEQALDNESIRNPAVNILASWDSLLAFMMLTRRPRFYGVVNCYDIDLISTANANELCAHWQFEYPKVYNHTRDINTLDFSNTGSESIFINCSVDQLDNTSWYDVIPDNRLVCFQCTDLPINTIDWDIKQSYADMSLFTETYKVQKLIYCDSININYEHLRFKRHMMIGIK